MTLFATYFDYNFLARGVACIESLIAQSTVSPRVLILALDEACESALRRIENFRSVPIEILPLSELERHHPELIDLKRTRTRVDYYFTLSPFLCAEAVKRLCRAEEYAVYIDADLFFF